jgi:hypothetical protein
VQVTVVTRGAKTKNIRNAIYVPFTYDHRTLKTRLPVRSALFKQRTGRLVVRWVTTSEYLLLYVFLFLWILADVVGSAGGYMTR